MSICSPSVKSPRFSFRSQSTSQFALNSHRIPYMQHQNEENPSTYPSNFERISYMYLFKIIPLLCIYPQLPLCAYPSKCPLRIYSKLYLFPYVSVQKCIPCAWSKCNLKSHPSVIILKSSINVLGCSCSNIIQEIYITHHSKISMTSKF